jgi:O-acetyl-ADP-ribose deacetylase (regulator of RNase III)
MTNEPLTQAEIETIVEAAVVKTLGHIGIDVSTPEALREFVSDQVYTRAWRKAVQKGTRVGLGTAVTVLVTGALAAFWAGIQVFLGRGQ